MNRKELIEKYTTFFEEKEHRVIQNASLVPQNDPTVLFTTAGMHPIVPYLSGQPHPLGKKLVGNQKCIRTGDIEEVGDSYHHTLFEMLGNWSLGDYFKKEAIELSFEFLTQILKLPIERLAVSVFAGNKNAPKDEEAYKAWKGLGFPEERIAFLEDNWWETPGPGPCGPDTEMFYWKPNNIPAPEEFDPEDNNWVEIWNDVLMEYKKTKEGNYVESNQKNIDTGMGLERTVAVLNGLEDNYEAYMWKPIIEKIEEITNKTYKDHKKEMRIIADHIKAAVFIINDKVLPSNSEQGYVLRRLIRGTVRNLKKIGVEKIKLKELAKEVFKIYDDYNMNEELILSELQKEKEKFEKTLDKGLRMFEKKTKDKKLEGKESFLLYQSYGFPIEMIEELAKEKGVEFNPEEFREEVKKHQELSQTASAGKFKSGLADHSEETTKLHTAAHLLLEALKRVLGREVEQKGSNITAERLRFDFNFDRKLTEEEKQEIEKIVNEEIKKSHEITREEMTLDEARKSGASGIFEDKYKGIISVYTIGDFSKEICTGPHVQNTKDMGTFKIIKEQSSSAGVRRIKAILE